MSYITAIGTANPSHKTGQSDIADFMVKAMQLNNGEERKLRVIFKSSGIDYRHSVLYDYSRKDSYTFFPDTAGMEPFPSTSKRMNAFRDHALPLSISAVEDAVNSANGIDLSKITHLITVCCTGMYAPGLDIELVKALGLSGNVQRTCINFMGCYAAINSLRVADAFCRSDSDAKVLIVCTELCSLHFQKYMSTDNLLANALFADGSAALIVEATPSTTASLLLEPLHFHSSLFTEGENDMAWAVGDLGFEMKLSAYVPDLIQKGIRQLTTSLLSGIQKSISGIKYFAVHPGGKRILDVTEKELGLTREQNAGARHVLRNFGNMSSPTILFVLKEIVRKIRKEDHDEYIVGFAFGPGLTLESMVLKIKTA